MELYKKQGQPKGVPIIKENEAQSYYQSADLSYEIFNPRKGISMTEKHDALRYLCYVFEVIQQYDIPLTNICLKEDGAPFIIKDRLKNYLAWLRLPDHGIPAALLSLSNISTQNLDETVVIRNSRNDTIDLPVVDSILVAEHMTEDTIVTAINEKAQVLQPILDNEYRKACFLYAGWLVVKTLGIIVGLYCIGVIIVRSPSLPT